LFYKSKIETLLGEMIAISDEESLFLLEFVDNTKLAKKLESLGDSFADKMSDPIKSINEELKLYFKGELKVFNTPLKIIGTDFRKKTWNALLRIPYGETISYASQASSMKMPKAFRAVANANGANCFPIIIPCHRVITSAGKLGGYSSGLHRKKWLLKHEATFN
jgi:O-6-methylguanine DNA methyltransferase